VLDNQIVRGDITMKRGIIAAGILVFLVTLTVSKGNTRLKSDVIDTIRITDSDIPAGFTYGTVPDVYKKTLKNNPWMMDRDAIMRLADKIYPGGDYNHIESIYVTILAAKQRPYGDDIVCYLMLFRDDKAAQEEIRKVTSFSGFNSDRSIVLTKDNLAVFLFVDDINNYHYIRDMAASIEGRMKKL
jgi:hypothetical protein